MNELANGFAMTYPSRPVSQRRVYDAEGRAEWVDEGHANGTSRWPGSTLTLAGTKVDADSGDTWSFTGPRLPKGPKTEAEPEVPPDGRT